MARLLTIFCAAAIGFLSGGLSANFLGAMAGDMERLAAGMLAGALLGMFTGTLGGELGGKKSDESGRAALAVLVGLLAGAAGSTQTALIRSLLFYLNLG